MSVEKVRFIVLDEADFILDEGHDQLKIVQKLIAAKLMPPVEQRNTLTRSHYPLNFT